jgi:hypothetical protein
MKSVPKIHDLLRKHNCVLTEHRWTEDIWNTTQLGFLQGLDPQFYDLAHATSKVATELKRHFPSKHKIPKFHLAYCRPKITYNGKQIRTKAYAIETEKSRFSNLCIKRRRNSHHFNCEIASRDICTYLIAADKNHFE